MKFDANQSDPGQLVMCGIPGPEMDRQTAEMIRRVRPGAFILFTRNIRTPRQLRALIDDLRSESAVEPIVAIDQEGGRVSRLKELGNEPPNANQLRDKADPALIERHGELTARLLRLFGLNLDLCPVLDISFDDDADNSLRGRCYGNDVAPVIRNAGLFNRALRAGGVTSCGKHFPGYSRAACDAHHELPVVDLSREELEANELAVFRAFASDLDSMMIGHVVYPALQPETGPGWMRRPPASLSPEIIGGLLRDSLGFAGLVMTDDLDMGAIVNHIGIHEMIRMALAAGNDIAMICHRFEELPAVRAAIESMGAAALEPAIERVARFKSKLSGPTSFSEAAFAALDAEVWKLRVDVLGEAQAAERSPDVSKRSPVELY
jgi:beta-N-acetylhexosaminidase